MKPCASENWDQNPPTSCGTIPWIKYSYMKYWTNIPLTGSRSCILSLDCSNMPRKWRWWKKEWMSTKRGSERCNLFPKRRNRTSLRNWWCGKHTSSPGASSFLVCLFVCLSCFFVWFVSFSVQPLYRYSVHIFVISFSLGNDANEVREMRSMILRELVVTQNLLTQRSAGNLDLSNLAKKVWSPGQLLIYCFQLVYRLWCDEGTGTSQMSEI